MLAKDRHFIILPNFQNIKGHYIFSLEGMNMQFSTHVAYLFGSTALLDVRDKDPLTHLSMLALNYHDS